MSIEKTEKKTEAVKEAQPVTETTGAAAYCGPTVKGIAPQYTVFVDGLPEKLKEKVEHRRTMRSAPALRILECS